MKRTFYVLITILAVLFIGFSLIAVPFGVPSLRHRWHANRIRPAALQTAMQRAQPIIGAINAYRQDHQKPPSSLKNLLPGYLRVLPDPGPLARGGWNYESGNANDNGGWSLSLEVKKEAAPNVWSLGDTFVYHPSGRYLREDYGGLLERVGAWGYYNE